MTENKDMPALQAVGENGKPTDMGVVEDAGVAFDPTTQHLDLTKDEKRRTTALMMAIQAYNNLIIKDAMMLRETADLARRNEGPVIRPATMNAMVEAAIQFDLFISGAYVLRPQSSEGQPAPTEVATPKNENLDAPSR